MCKGASKLKKYTAPGPRPPVLKFLDPPLNLLSDFKVNKTLLLIFKIYASIDVGTGCCCCYCCCCCC